MAPHVVIASRTFEGHTQDRSLLVRTPLDLIQAIEKVGSIAMVVLVDSFAGERELASFIHGEYPWLRLVTIHAPPDSAEPSWA